MMKAIRTAIKEIAFWPYAIATYIKLCLVAESEEEQIEQIITDLQQEQIELQIIADAQGEGKLFVIRKNNAGKLGAALKHLSGIERKD